MSSTTTGRQHGGPGAAGAVRWDFSTNVNAAGPCPQALAALAAADPARYPDPGYHALRERLAGWHGVACERIVLAASGSEFIQRITAVSARLAPGPVAIPAAAYGDYAVAAAAWGRASTVASDATATLRWCADPSSPLGQDAVPPANVMAVPTVLDAAYAPLRLQGSSGWNAAAQDSVFRLYSPNKALGLPGVRGAYAIAPAQADWPVARWCDALEQTQPSWPLGSHAVALLQAWTEPATQHWLAASRQTLRVWTASLRAGLDALGLQPQASVTPFLCARRPACASASWMHARGLAVRDTTSFGLPGLMRISAQPPDALHALLSALQEAECGTPNAGRPMRHPLQDGH
jgi:histidinol-phosphate aminotransferase